MSRSARVTSIDVLQTMAAAVQRFRGEAAGVLDDLEIEIHRALEWIHHDRKDYWTHELRRSYEAVSQARLQLQQAQTARRIAGHEPSCIDEKRALDRAKRRLEIAEQKVKAVQHWTAPSTAPSTSFSEAAPNLPPGSTATCSRPWPR